MPSSLTSKALATRLIVALVAGQSVASAQCPDGTPPPCRSSAGSSLGRLPPPLDRNRFVVFPLAAANTIGGTDGAGLDVASMIIGALDRHGALRAIDGGLLLARERGRNSGGRLDPARARSLARAQGAAHYVSGRIVLHGDSADVLLDLTDVARDSTALRATSRGSSRDLWRASIRAVNLLVPALVPNARPDDFLDEWSSRDPAAVSSFLAAEAALRRAEPEKAFALYREAVRADSQFVLAAVRGAQAASQSHRVADGVAFMRAAANKPTVPQYTAFVQGVAAYLDGFADSASAAFRRAVALDPELAAAWMQLGETYVHLTPSGANPDSVAEDAFAHARALDPSATYPLMHTIELQLRRGGSAAESRLVRAFSAAKAASSDQQAYIQLIEDCVHRGPSRVDWQAAVRADARAVLGAGALLAGHGANLPCAVAAYATILDFDTVTSRDNRVAERQAALAALVGVLVAQGHASAAASRIAESMARGDGGSSLLLLASTVARELDSAAASVARNDSARFGPDFARCSTTERCWILAVYAASHGRPDATAAIATALAARTTSDSSRELRALTKAATAHAALARGDSATAFELFRAVLESPLGPSGASLAWNPGGALGAERLAYARLLLARHDAVTARAVADGFDSAAPTSFLLYLRASLELRIDIAKALGDVRAAATYRFRLAALSSPMGRE